MKTITITVAASGEITIKTEGFSGSSCKEATAAIEKALGKTVLDTPTGEMHGEQSKNVGTIRGSIVHEL